MIVKGEHNIIKDCDIGEGTVVWSHCNLYGCTIGRDCMVGSYVEIGRNVKIGNSCKVQSFSYIPEGVTIGDNVFVGPRVTFTNDKYPRAKGGWVITKTIVKSGATIGAGATIVCGLEIGRNAMVGAGAVVTRDVPEHNVVVGNPAKSIRKC